jgi:hypothetical protein
MSDASQAFEKGSKYLELEFSEDHPPTYVLAGLIYANWGRDSGNIIEYFCHLFLACSECRWTRARVGCLQCDILSYDHPGDVKVCFCMVRMLGCAYGISGVNDIRGSSLISRNLSGGLFFYFTV